MKVTSDVMDLFPPETETTGDGTEVDVECPLEALCDMIFAAKCEIALLRPGFQGTYEVAIRGEEADVRAFIEAAGWGTDAGYVWNVTADGQLTYTEE